MKFSLRVIAVCVGAIVLAISTVSSRAFALLGPVQPWMQATNGVALPGDTGGPMPIGCGYRWNVPVVTYGFDQSFLDYFGSNGVAAVEGAIQILNNLPPASQIVATNYPFFTEGENFQAQAESLLDLKSYTLSLLLEHLGLATPTRYIYVLYQWSPVLTNEDSLLPDTFEGTNLVNYIDLCNYDPQSLNASPYVNETLYSGSIYSDGLQNWITPFAVDPEVSPDEAVADITLDIGWFFNGLTRDDIGGLAYLLSTNAVNYETLITGMTGAGTNSSSFVNGAWRPGVDKITFIPQPVDSQSGAFLPTTNYFTDSYFINGVAKQQQMQRVILQPDFRFSAADVAPTNQVPYYTRTGTTNWLNNATANGNPGGSGPGVIQPQVQIIFNKLGLQFYNTSDVQVVNQSAFWGSFDGSANAPVAYPAPKSGTNQTMVRMWLTLAGNQQSFVWQPEGLSGAQFAMQTSPDLLAWTTLFTITNDGSVSTFINYKPTSPARFYRVVPE